MATMRSPQRRRRPAKRSGRACARPRLGSVAALRLRRARALTGCAQRRAHRRGTMLADNVRRGSCVAGK